ncbi:hypothetical protein [Amycolatopsis sp. NPDC051071]
MIWVVLTTQITHDLPAQRLGFSRATIYRKIHEYGIVAPSRNS